ncbi:MAG: LytTR family DNA-binding domain-containing protein [Gemmatimonadota bacterium]
MNTLRAVVVDDEPLTRERIVSLIAEHDTLELVGTARNGIEGLDLIARVTPDVVFLDVQMPELDGFETIAALEPEKLPAIVMVTAFEQYALRAFDAGVVDYLHKPVTKQRFGAAVARVSERFARRTGAESMEIVQRAAVMTRQRGFRTRYVVRSGTTHHFVAVSTVHWIDVADNYLQLHTTARTHLYRGSMKEAEEELDPALFVRVHRSAMVALGRVTSVRARAGGGFVVELRGGVQVAVSRQYAERVREWLV